MSISMELKHRSIAKTVESWRLVQKLPNYRIVVGEILFRQIFELAPGALSLYGFGYGMDEDDIPENLFSSPCFISHAKSVVSMLETALNLMVDNKLEDLSEALAGLGARHVKYGVQPAHYVVVEAALLRTLEIGLQDKFTASLRRHWAAVFKFVAKAMMMGAQNSLVIKRSSATLLLKWAISKSLQTLEHIYDECSNTHHNKGRRCPAAA